MVVSQALFINNFNYLFIDSEGIAFHRDPKLIPHFPAKYVDGSSKRPSLYCEHTYKLKQAWYTNTCVIVKSALQFVSLTPASL